MHYVSPQGSPTLIGLTPESDDRSKSNKINPGAGNHSHPFALFQNHRRLVKGQLLLWRFQLKKSKKCKKSNVTVGSDGYRTLCRDIHPPVGKACPHTSDQTNNRPMNSVVGHQMKQSNLTDRKNILCLNRESNPSPLHSGPVS